MDDFTTINAKIDTLRNETAANGILPEHVASILQDLADHANTADNYVESFSALASAAYNRTTALSSSLDSLSSSVGSLVGSISLADIDLADWDSQRRKQAARRSAEPAFYKVTLADGRLMGVMLLFSDTTSCQLTQVLFTNSVLEDGSFASTHDDGKIHVYRRNLGNAVHQVGYGSESWSAWTEIAGDDFATRLDNLEESVSDHASALTAHDTRISNVQTAVESLSADAEGHLQMLGEQSARITSIEEGIEKIVGTIELGHLDLDDVDRHEMMVAFASNRMPALYVVKAMSLSGGVLTMFCSGSPERLEQVLVTRWKLMPDGKFHTSQQNAGARVYQRSIEGFGGASEGEWSAWTEIAGEGVAASIAEARAIAEEAIPQSALTSETGNDPGKAASQKLVGEQLAGVVSTIDGLGRTISKNFVKKIDIATELAPEEEGQSDDKVASQSLVASVKDALDSQCASLDERLVAAAENAVTWDYVAQELGTGDNSNNKVASQKLLTESLAAKADKEGVYDSMTVGQAKQLLPDSGIIASGRYCKRTTDGEASVMSGAAQIASLKGMTIKQMLKNANFSEGAENWGGASADADFEADYVRLKSGRLVQMVDFVPGHSYYFSFRYKSDRITYISLDPGGSVGLTPAPVSDTWRVHSASRIVGPAIASGRVQISILEAGSLIIDKSYGIRLIDLTEMGLDAVAGLTIAQLDELFGNKHIPYGLSSFTPQSHKAVGFQQFDKDSMAIEGKAIDVRPVQVAECGGDWNEVNSPYLRNISMEDMGDFYRFASTGDNPRAIFFDCNTTAGHIYYIRAKIGLPIESTANITVRNVKAPYSYENVYRGRRRLSAGVNVFSFVTKEDNSIGVYAPLNIDGVCLAFSIENWGSSHIDIYKDTRFACIDLTAMGCETTLPNGKPTTAENCDEYFGDAYIPYNDGSTYGQLMDDALKSLAAIPCLKSEVGTGKNNGYRIKGDALVVGWNPFHPNSGCFDKAYGVAEDDGSGYVDYAQNGNGYLLVIGAKSAIEDLIAHFRWSYTDEQFAEMYEGKAKYKESIVSLGAVGELKGLFSNGTLVADEANFSKGKLVRRIGERPYDADVDVDNPHVLTDGVVTFYRLAAEAVSRLDVPTLYACDDFGTEEMVSNVPMGGVDVEYYENLKDNLRMLTRAHAEDLAAIASLEERVAELEARYEQWLAQAISQEPEN